MTFNVSKCKVMHLGTNNISSSYSMDGQLLDVVSTQRDLGVIITSNLNVAEHCYHAYSKANRMLGLVKRTIKHRNPSLMVQLYKSLVRPHLEFCSPVWNPHYTKDNQLLEKVQHRFTRLFPDLRALTYEARLKVLGLWSLEERRNRSDLLEVYKMAHGFSTVPLTSFFQLVTDSCTRGHSWKLVKPHCRTDARKYFFSVRVITRWNSLPQEAVNAPSVNAFKHQLNKIRQSRMGYFMDS